MQDRRTKRALLKDSASIIDKNFKSLTEQCSKIPQTISEEEPYQHIRSCISPNPTPNNHLSEECLVHNELVYHENSDIEEESFELYDSSSDESANNILIDDEVENLHTTDTFSYNSLSIKDKLTSWTIQYNPSREAVNALLSILKEEIPNLPKDKRTLCSTPRYSTIYDMDNGYYLHIGLKVSLLKFMSKTKNMIFNENIYIDINVDGVPISKSSPSSLWPILINVVGSEEVICIGTFYGNEKPQNVNNYLNRFVEEFIEIHETGLLFNGRIYKLHIRAISADAPARAFLLNIHTHSGYSSCHKCHIRGKYILNRVTFPPSLVAARTDAEYRNKTDFKHHLTLNSIEVEKLPIDCIKSFVVDYMHVALEGVLKQLMMQWIFIRKKSYSLRKSKIESLSNSISFIAYQLPHEFSRTPRSLQYLKRYKATEFRQLLLYTLPVLTYDILEKPIYNHFLKFHCALRILCSKNFYSVYGELANELIQFFIEEFNEIYDDHQYSFNLHSLLHLYEDVIYFKSPLDSFSCFKFENFLQILKKIVKSGNNPLQQINNRYVERFFNDNSFNLNNKKEFSKYRDGSYMYLFLNCFKYSNKAPNNYCFSYREKTFIKIVKITDSICSGSYIIHGHKILELYPIYTDPIDSREIGLFKSEQYKLGDIDIFQLDDNIVKALYLNLNNVNYFITLIH